MTHGMHDDELLQHSLSILPCMTRSSVIADPAAESFAYPAAIDIRELVTLEDVMEQLELGPNGCGHLAQASAASGHSFSHQ